MRRPSGLVPPRRRRGGGRGARDERGAGSIAALAVIAVVVMLAGALLPALGALRLHALLAGAADAAALAAADTLAGRTPGYPCDNARLIVDRAHAELAECRQQAATMIVEVRVIAPYGLARIAARARAGPPGSR